MPIANCFQTDKDWYVDWKKKREQLSNFMHWLLVYSSKPSTSILRPNQPKVVKLLQFWEVLNIWAGFAVERIYLSLLEPLSGFTVKHLVFYYLLISDWFLTVCSFWLKLTCRVGSVMKLQCLNFTGFKF